MDNNLEKIQSDENIKEEGKKLLLLFKDVFRSEKGHQVLMYLSKRVGLLTPNPKCDAYQHGQRDLVIEILHLIQDKPYETELKIINSENKYTWSNL